MHGPCQLIYGPCQLMLVLRELMLVLGQLEVGTSQRGSSVPARQPVRPAHGL